MPLDDANSHARTFWCREILRGMILAWPCSTEPFGNLDQRTQQCGNVTELQAGSFSGEVSFKSDNRRVSDVRQTVKDSEEKFRPRRTL